MAPKSVPVPMITRVRLKNFRSIAECDVELGPLTILVGPNGSGKSNFVRALDFISDAVSNGLDAAVSRGGGMFSLLSRWALDVPDVTLEIAIEFSLDQGRHGAYAISLRRAKSSSYKIVEECCTVTSGSAAQSLEQFVINGEKREWSNTRGYVQPLPDLGSGALTLPHHADHVHVGAVYRALRGIASYSLHVSAMRRPQEPDGRDRLASDGANIAAILDLMAENNEHGWSPAQQVADWLGVVTPGIVAVRSTNVAGYQALQFEQRRNDGAPPWTFTAGEMSYGTLRTLGVLVALYQGSTSGGAPVTLVGIEEPETAVHPGAATAILEAMDEASLTTQVLATSHSVTMLDYEDLDLGILRAAAVENGRTVIGPVDVRNRRVIREGLYTAGELFGCGDSRRMERSIDGRPTNSLRRGHERFPSHSLGRRRRG